MIVLCLSAILVSGVFAGCTHEGGAANGSHTSDESSYLSWIGRFQLEKMELNGSIFVKSDFESMRVHPNQYVILNRDGTGELAIATYPSDYPLEPVRISYTFDLANESGYISIEGYSDRMRFTLNNGVLVLDAIGATWTFKK